MANDDFSEPPRRADSKNPIFFFSRFLGLGHLQGLGVRLGRILGVLSIEPFLGERGGPAGGFYRPPPPPGNENPASPGRNIACILSERALSLRVRQQHMAQARGLCCAPGPVLCVRDSHTLATRPGAQRRPVSTEHLVFGPVFFSGWEGGWRWVGVGGAVVFAGHGRRGLRCALLPLPCALRWCTPTTQRHSRRLQPRQKVERREGGLKAGPSLRHQWPPVRSCAGAPPPPSRTPMAQRLQGVRVSGAEAGPVEPPPPPPPEGGGGRGRGVQARCPSPAMRYRRRSTIWYHPRPSPPLAQARPCPRNAPQADWCVSAFHLLVSKMQRDMECAHWEWGPEAIFRMEHRKGWGGLPLNPGHSPVRLK